MAQFVDWDLAEATASAFGKSGPRISLAEARQAVAEIRDLVPVAQRHVAEFTALVGSQAPARVVDRPGWAAANIAGLRRIAGPLLSGLHRRPGPVAEAVGSRLAAVQAGSVLAYLSGRVLGQYEVFAADPGQLLLVAPNIVEAQRRLGAQARDFQLWVCLHEATHQLQFTAVGWLREYFLDQVRAFLAAGGQEQPPQRVQRLIAAAAEALRRPGGRAAGGPEDGESGAAHSLLELIQSPEQAEILGRLTALMTVLEGHAEFVMDGVGPQVVPSVEQIRRDFNRRRETSNPVERLARRLLGVDAKLRQYAQGSQFVATVVAEVGMDGFNQVWRAPRTLPREEELAEPLAWVRRVGVSAGRG